MQSTKPTILCTGPLDPERIDLSHFAGVEIDVIPFTTIDTVASDALREKIRATLDEQINVVFTSSNAVKVVASVVGDSSPAWNIYCIGNTTFHYAAKIFDASRIKATAATAGRLAEKIMDDDTISAITFFCGNLRRSELPDMLAEKNISVEEIVVYQTSLTPVTIGKDYDAIIFFSPSSAESFFSRNSVLQQTNLFVMGSTTADHIRKFSDNPVITGKEPDKYLLIKEAVDYLIEKGQMNKN